MFVIDAAIGVPIAFYTLFVDPNTPSTTTAFFFNDRDVRVALERRRRIGAQLNTRENYTWKKIKSFFSTWHIWIFTVLFLTFNNSYQPISAQAFQQWMKYDLKLAAYEYNIYSTAMSGGGIGLAIVASYLNDYFNGSYNLLVLGLMYTIVVFSCGCLAAWNIPIGLHWFAYYGIAISLAVGQPMIFSWVNRTLHHDDMKRNFVVVCPNTLAYVTGAWVPIFTFNQTKAPRFHTGFAYTAALLSLGLILTIVVQLLFWRNDRRERKRIENSKNFDHHEAQPHDGKDFQRSGTSFCLAIICLAPLCNSIYSI